MPLFANSQTFEKIIDLDASVYPMNLVETKNGFLMSAVFSKGQHLEYESNIIELNKKCEIIKNVKYRDYYSHYISKLWIINDTTYGALGIAAEGPDSAVKIVYYQLTGNLEVTYTTEYITETRLDKIVYFNTDIYVNSDKSIVFQLAVRSNKSGYYFTKYNKSGELVNSNCIYSHDADYAAITTNQGSGYLFFDDSWRYGLDSNLMVVDSFLLNNNHYHIMLDPIWENDSIIIISIPHNYNTDFYEMGLCRTKMGKDIIEEKRFAVTAPHEMYPWYNSFDTSGNSFYIAANTNFSGTSNYYLHNNSIRIIRVNNDFSVKWDKLYNINNGYNFLFYLIATSDGGCIVAGVRYNPDVPDRMDDLIYLLKVDSLGNYTSTDIAKTALRQSHMSLYPNPGNNEINLQLPCNNKTAIFSLYNISGKKVLSKRANAAQTTITTECLPNGLYIYELRKNGEVLDRGKWVKR